MHAPSFVRAAALLAIVAAAPAAAQTVTIGNASAVGSNSIGHYAPGTVWIGQTFVVPEVSNILQSFALRTYGNTAATFELYAFDGTALVGAPLFTHALEEGPGTQHQAISFGSGLQLASAASYAAVVRVEQGDYVAVAWSGGSDAYAGGGFLTCFTGSTTCTVANVDATFGATFVSERVTATPEPATVALLGGGLFALGGVGAVRRRVRA
jgi:hypothetical protein